MAMQSNYQEYGSVKDYLTLGEESETKHEYIDGEIYALPGGIPTHSKIIYNIGGLLFAQLRNSPCGGFDSNLRIQISTSQYVYPDFTVVCE